MSLIGDRRVKSDRTEQIASRLSGSDHIQRDSQPTTLSLKVMSTSNNPTLLFQSLSIELWERIFLFTSPRDILRLSLVRNIIHVVRFCAFSQRRIFERSIALPMHLCGHPLPFNTRSISLRLD